MTRGKKGDWNTIYSQYGKISSENREKIEDIYKNVKKNHYTTLDDCVNHAITNGNHIAFVHFYMEKIKSQKEIFLKILWQYMDEYEAECKKNKNLPAWSNFKIIKKLECV